ncbi:MAG: class I SAM-dependent methyltransferase [Acidobacteria bacterium]|nr:MAG: class I SAM-dependent methyltransferase [Acidobacteriota bacterium]REK01320.1 MAG: class I SAM-dependent methyltransferase [Acidobacteriota bacterium]REK14276.1 MAG: class I SAM-dependent methyltransferase [Acidobacteriota bacterium]REK44991.1 MAG: class I SAM-dependent methyltransferase [Acidobacteriota bacterium]
MAEKKKVLAHYDAQYTSFATDLYSRIRARVFGEDYGQNGWQTADEQDRFIEWLSLGDSDLLLDVACGSGGPTTRIVGKTGCRAVGIDINPKAIDEARSRAESAGISQKATFRTVEGKTALDFEDGSFDGLICIDAVNHLPDRSAVFAEWKRILKPGGRIVITDPIVVTGPITDQEMRVRSSIGFFIFVPPEVDKSLLDSAGFEVEPVQDLTGNMARIAARWRRAREENESELRRIEGDETYYGQQEFLDVAARLAKEKRLSRHLLLGTRR